jgi:hypothetical protein
MVVNVLTTLNVATSVFDRGLAASGSWLAAPTNGNWEPAAGQTNWTNGTGVGAFPGAVAGTSEEASRIDAASVATNAIRENSKRNKLFIVWLG